MGVCIGENAAARLGIAACLFAPVRGGSSSSLCPCPLCIVTEKNEKTCSFCLHQQCPHLSDCACPPPHPLPPGRRCKSFGAAALQLIDDCSTRHARKTVAELACLDAQLGPDAVACCCMHTAVLIVDAGWLNIVLHPYTQEQTSLPTTSHMQVHAPCGQNHMVVLAAGPSFMACALPHLIGLRVGRPLVALVAAKDNSGLQYVLWHRHCTV